MSEASELNDELSGATTVNQAWVLYRKYILPANAPPIQVQETSMAFYAAADWMFKRLIDACSNDTEEAAEKLLESFGKELEEYKESLLE